MRDPGRAPGAARSGGRAPAPSTPACRIPAGRPLLPGPNFAGPYHLPGDPEGAPYDYGRYGNPTWSRYEAGLGELEGGDAVVFSSGMAAITAVLYVFAGDDSPAPVVVPEDGYFMTRRVAARMGAARGLEVRRCPTATEAIVAAVDGARLVIVETPSNPGLDRATSRRWPRPPARRARCWPSTTRSPRRCASVRSSSAPICRSAPAPRPSPATPT